MLAPDKSMLTRAERVFTDFKMQYVAPVAPWTTGGLSYDLHGSIDKLLMEELRTKYSAAKMNGISVDPVTHALRLPEVLPCSKIEIAEMRALHAMYNTDVFEEATNCINMLPGVRNKASERPCKSDGKLTSNWLRMSGFDSSASNNALKLKERDRRSFPWRGGRKISASPGWVAVQARSGDLVLIVEDKESKWHFNNGHVAQIFGQALSCMYHNYFTNSNRHATRPTKIHAVRMYNHFVTFFTLHATEAQVDAVCHHKKLPASFTKMTLESNTQDSACILNKHAPIMRDAREYMGFNMIEYEERREAQLSMAKLRNML
ncbi:Hypothetical protein, putative [Bodo saltans]|uniref:Uncharacterized protein n=1 Tax=Bodo saltans TaxID=75058 RepID=A0A0S4JDV8_BODSA|nr:Hypothetical protein, putative [Bodo saltans]|eukprot:CUG88219.1 Hypothetical protein, putative [Bodo saltans]